MNIRQLIDILTQYEHDSDQQSETKVSITLHVQEWNASGFNIELPIYDVEIVYDEKDSVEISVELTTKKLEQVKQLNQKLIAMEN